MKKSFAVLLSVCLLLSLCACGGNGAESTTATTTEATQSTTETQDDGKVTYTVTVVDEAGEPMPKVMVQLCKDSCIPAMTDEQGNALFQLAEDDYKASVTVMPEGYTTESGEYYFEDGSLSLTITLKAAA